MDAAGCQRDAVVLVHGLAAHRLLMVPLGRRLAPGFGRVVNWGYRSVWWPIERHSRLLANFFDQLDDDSAVDRVHLVTHSMGGIVMRRALQHRTPRKLGRVVMVAPPNAGSHVARALQPWLGRVCPPLGQLTDESSSFVCQLSPPQLADSAIGVIAAIGDYMVPEASTHLPGEADHIVLPGLHSSILWRQETANQVRLFLEHGHFDHAARVKTGS